MDKTKLKSRVILCSLLVILVVIWQFLSEKGMINQMFFSSPKAVWQDLKEMFGSGYIFPHLKVTLCAAFLGLILWNCVWSTYGIFSGKQ